MLSVIFATLLLQATYLDAYNGAAVQSRHGNYREAAELLKQSLDANPKYVPAQKALAENYVKLKRIGDAIDIYRNIVRQSPGDINARARLAELYAWSGDHDKSIVAYREAIAIDPANLVLMNGLATVLRWTNRYEEAERLYKKALAAAPANHDALKGLAKTLSMQGEYTRAVEIIDRAIRFYPDDAELYKEKAVVLSWMKDYNSAVALLKKAVDLSPSYVEAYRTLGDVYSWMKAKDLAEESYKKAVELEPGNVDNHMLLAGAYMASDKIISAEETVKAALRIDPSDAKAQKLLHDIREKGRVPLLVRVGSAVKLIGLILVLAALLAISVARKRMLRRRHAVYFYLLRYVLPTLVIINLSLYVWNDYFSQRFEVALVSDITEAILMISFGVSFFAFYWAERRSKNFSKDIILAVGAHPDDIELGCGGFILKAKDSGSQIYGLIMSRGEKGGARTGAASSEGQAAQTPASEQRKAVNREQEARAAGRFMELDELWVLDLPDTCLHEHVNRMKDEIEEKIKATGATIVLAHTAIDIHSDHRAVFEGAKVASRNISLMCYEDISTPREFVPNYYVDISDFIGDKVSLVGYHKSQSGKSYMDPEVVKGRAAHRGIQSGVRYAEAFRIYKLLR